MYFEFIFFYGIIEDFDECLSDIIGQNSQIENKWKCINDLLKYNQNKMQQVQIQKKITKENHSLPDHFASTSDIDTISNQTELQTKTSTIGRCLEHPETEMTLFNVNTLTHYCPKCVIYSNDMDKYKDAIFVEIDNKTNNVDVVLGQKFNTLQTKLNKIKDSLMSSVQNQRQRVQKNVYGKLNQKYRQFLEQLNKHKRIQEEKIKNKIEKLWNNFWKESVQQFSKFEQNLLNLKKSVSKCSESEIQKQKYCSISKAIKMLNNMETLNKNIEIQSELTVNSLKKYSNEYQCGLKMQSNQKYPLLLTKRSSTLEKKQLFQKQLDSQELLTSGLQAFDEKLQKIEEQFPTENSINFSVSFSQNDKSYMEISTQRPNIPAIQKIQKHAAQKTTRPSLLNTTILSNPKTHLTLTNINSLNKIQTQIRDVEAKNLQFTNLDGKKVINLISKSFVKTLDLSNNRINNMFLKDLNKAQIGKYLKTIKLSGNHIQAKDPAISKKIQQLKMQGVNIIL